MSTQVTRPARSTAFGGGHPGTEPPPELLRPIVRNLLRHPLRPVVVDDYRTWRGAALFLGAAALSREIARRTDCPRIGLMLPTSGLFPLGLIASWLAGRAVVPINYLLKAEQRDEIIRDAELDLIVSVAPMLRQFGRFPPDIKAMLLDELPRVGLPLPRRPPKVNPDATVAILYTSGTSGRPKGVELTARNLAANAWQCTIRGEVTTRDIFLGVLPQFHSFGFMVLTLLPLATGSRVVYTARFVPKRIFELLREHRPTGFIGIPSMYRALLAEGGAEPDDFASVRLLISGGEPLPIEVHERFESRFHRSIHEGYGLTETGPVLNWASRDDAPAGSVGPVLPAIEERLIDSTGQAVRAGEEGEVCVRGPNVMKGYFGRPESTAAVFDSDGYFHTGDLGRIDERGNLFITGRLSDLIVVAGENVFPREIETVLNRHESLADSAVIGVPDRLRGEVPVAFVELKDGHMLDEGRLRAHCRQQLPGYKVPRRIMAIEELPRGPTGKVLKHLLPRDAFMRKPDR